MGRAPCCEKTGLKKGSWTKEEDHALVTYINQHGQGNWRSLPKKAGLLRCGKSCRLRWTNYLRPDIKRGNFTKEEEDTILQLHQDLGNKWSAIATRLPGRTDNEIKNMWHTHLKKRLTKQPISENKQEGAAEDGERNKASTRDHQDSEKSSAPANIQSSPPQPSVGPISPTIIPNGSSPSTAAAADPTTVSTMMLDQDFWLDTVCMSESHGLYHDSGGFAHYDMDFWCDLFARTDHGIPELLEF